ncbi:MAG: cell division protein FtsH, partial [Microgenomates group bacterium]|nr:cell division protein FtsH [Microgenomates group bacterium]
PINFGPTTDITEWGKTYFEQNNISQEMQAKIDAEIKKIIDQAYQRALEILKAKKDLLDKVAKRLIKEESLDEEEFEKIVGQKKKLA